MFCKKCGTEMKEEWKVCPKCGNTVEEKGINLSPEIDNVLKTKKVKKPFFKRVWFWIIVVVVISVFASVSGSDSDTSDGGTKGDTTRTEDTTTQDAEADASSPLGIYTSTADNELVPYTINSKAAEFLKVHADYFPSSNYNQISGAVDTSIEYKHIEKKSENYGDKLLELPELYVMSIEESDLGDGKKFTEVETTDGNNFYYILYIGELSDVFKEDTIKANGLPLGISGYKNTSGGSTTTLVLAGAYIEKISIADEY